MTIAQQITEEVSSMQAQAQQQVLDFALFLKQKEQNELRADTDAFIKANMPALKELAK